MKNMAHEQINCLIVTAELQIADYHQRKVKLLSANIKVRFNLTSQLKQKRPAVARKAKKGAAWKFTLDLTHPVEDGILDSANFVSLTALI